MTYEDLLVAIDKEAPKLKCCALRLLLRLVAIAIEEGTNEVRASRRYLSNSLGLSNESIDEATRGLAHLMKIDASGGVTRCYTMPVEWFTPQRSLFVSAGAADNLHNWPKNQATTGLESRPPLAYNPGRSGPESRPQWPGNQADMPGNQAAVAQNPGRSGLEYRPVTTENQQLTDAALIRSDQDLINSSDSVVNQISQIAMVEKLREEQKEVATLLSLDLQEYMRLHNPSGVCEGFPAERILARCLAIADLNTLQKTLITLHTEGRTSGRKYAWFVTVFINRIYGIDSEIVLETFERVLRRKKPQRETTPLFPAELLQQTAAGVRPIR